jgi:tetratricopeptide (TPR) repeat protein
MRWTLMGALGLLVGVVTGAAGPARADEAKPPQNVKAEPSTPASAELSSRAASADMAGNPQYGVSLADRAIRADPKDPWPYYNKGMALAQAGEVDGALAAFVAAEQHFSPTDRWGRSVAAFGRAHTLAMAGRCAEARQAFDAYAALNRGDENAVKLANRYSADCEATARSTSAQTPAPAAPTEKK